jgi:hypothetical protein
MREFKFFHGRKPHKHTAIWDPNSEYRLDLEDEITSALSDELSRAVDELLIRSLTRTINGGDNNNVNYLNHYINMGGGNRA